MKIINSGAKTILQLEGNINLDETEALELKLDKLLSEEKTKVVVDLSGVRHFSSSALGILVAYKKAMQENGGDIKLVVNSDELMQLFKVTMLSKVFEISDSRKDALTRF